MFGNEFYQTVGQKRSVRKQNKRSITHVLLWCYNKTVPAVELEYFPGIDVQMLTLRSELGTCF